MANDHVVKHVTFLQFLRYRAGCKLIALSLHDRVVKLRIKGLALRFNRFNAQIFKLFGQLFIDHTHALDERVFLIVLFDRRECPFKVVHNRKKLFNDIPFAESATPGDPAVGENCVKALQGRNGCLMGNHGAVTYGATLDEAFEKAMLMEHLCEKVYFQLLAEKHLERVGLLKYFDAVASAKQVEHGKPAPDIYIYAASLLGLKPEECIALEDSPNGIRSAHAAGCKTVMVPDLDGAAEEIKPLLYYIADGLADVIRIIEN